MNPGVAMIIAAAISAAAQGAGEVFGGAAQKRAAKRRSKEMRRETYGGLLTDAAQRSSELEAHRLAGSQRTAKRRAQSMAETSDLVRGALQI